MPGQDACVDRSFASTRSDEATGSRNIDAKMSHVYQTPASPTGPRSVPRRTVPSNVPPRSLRGGSRRGLRSSSRCQSPGLRARQHNLNGVTTVLGNRSLDATTPARFLLDATPPRRPAVGRTRARRDRMLPNITCHLKTDSRFHHTNSRTSLVVHHRGRIEDALALDAYR